MNLKYLFALTILTVLASCQNKKGGNSLPPVNNNDVNIAYTDSQAGDTTLLFVHGWCINKSYWQDQVNYFSKNYRVITIDLPGYDSQARTGLNLMAKLTQVM
ncbi:MAG: alpha/beta hydrolase [Mucilaginibacter sp.]|nr:alpha/beta hydrolase [Mucilaginibacter sp.]